MSQLSVEAEGTTRAGPEVVWSLVANANTFPQWGPWSDGGYRPPAPGPSQVGSVQWFRYGRRTMTPGANRCSLHSCTWCVLRAGPDLRVQVPSG